MSDSGKMLSIVIVFGLLVILFQFEPGLAVLLFQVAFIALFFIVKKKT